MKVNVTDGGECAQSAVGDGCASGKSKAYFFDDDDGANATATDEAAESTDPRYPAAPSTQATTRAASAVAAAA